MKIIDFAQTINTRDMGGYTSADGKTIKPFRFIRSDALNHLSNSEIDYLLSNGVSTSIDLRTPRIASKYQSSLKNDIRFAYSNIPLYEGSDIPLDEEKVPELYMAMLANYGTFKAIFDTMVSTDSGVVYNCSAGKDRTGMVSFLLLEFAKVPRDVIAEDYALSSILKDQKIEQVRLLNPDFPSFSGESKKEYIERLFVLFDKTYGSIERYFDIIGFDAGSQDALRAKLFE